MSTEPNITEFFQDAIRAQIVAAFSAHSSKFFEQFAEKMLGEKVSDNGYTSRYSSDNKHTLLEYLCMEALREATREEAQRWVEEKREDLRKALRASLEARADDFANSLVKQVVDAAKSQWRFDIKISPPHEED